MNISLEELQSLRTEGEIAVQDLAKMAEMLGYKEKFGHLQCKNGAYITNFLNFLEDNPGAVEAIHKWVEEFYIKDDSIKDDT